MMEEKTIFKKVVNTNGVISCDELDITVEEWKKVLQDSLVYNNYKLWLARFYQEVEHKATCKYMGEKYKCSSQTPNSVITKFGIAARKILNRFEIQEADGSQTYWVIPMKKGQTVSGAFEWTMRDELVQAMEELGMTDPEEFEKKTSFTWIPFYTEMAEKLLKYKDNRDELVKIVYGMDNEYINYFKDDKKEKFQDLHPFAFFCIFNRQISTQKRLKICSYLKEKLEIKTDLPIDFTGIPFVNNQNSWWGMPWTKNDAKEDININWKLFEISQRIEIDNKNFGDSFNFVLSRGGTKRSLTMALYWIRPYEFMPLDANSREYLQKIGINVFDEKDLNGQNYLDLCELIKDKIANNEIKEKSIPEISNNAWLKEPQGDTQMTQEDTLVKKYANLLKNTKNIILTGAPGTGKTFMAKQIAKELGCKDDNIGFVQFHPSYDYTDFVEGLRPTDKDGNGNVGFERRDGVFKEFCEKALKINDEEINDFFFDRQFSVKGDLTGFNVIIKDENIEITNPYYNIESSKSEFRDYLNNTELVDKNRKKIQILVYDYIRNEILKNKKQNFVFIIDEINRGEVAKIFGELFYCIDPGYRGEKGRISTQYQNLVTSGEFQKGFFIPENVYIIGTMNDIDRSVESMDFAFRR
ncbi:MAG: AAA family ATPase, partial [Treponema sp.]|nr:AAA family ATPase [Treponema sp.]